VACPLLLLPGAAEVSGVKGGPQGRRPQGDAQHAQEGADIIAIDIARANAYPILGYATATEAELADTVKQVEALDRRIIARQVDVRDAAGLKRAVDEGVSELGKLDIVCNVAGINDLCYPLDETSDERWDAVLGLDLKAPFQVCRAAIKGMVKRQGGVILNIASDLGVKHGLGDCVGRIRSRLRQPDHAEPVQRSKKCHVGVLSVGLDTDLNQGNSRPRSSQRRVQGR